jgi:NADP-dependent 3-hydroxy acid dehydrogenase YdfG
MDGSIDGETAVITGASSGIGEATAHALAREGANVVLAARREHRLDAIAATIRGTYDVGADGVVTDVRESEAVSALVESAVDRFGGLDILVNNAGLARGDDVETMADEQYRTMMETNVDGTFFATRAAIPHLRESEGTLVFVGSFAGQYPRPFNPVYAATKWWLRGFARSVEASVGSDGVAVTVVNPSEVRTEFGDAVGEPFEERFDEGEVLEPEEVAEAIAFATRQPSAVSGLDLYRRDKLSFF